MKVAIGLGLLALRAPLLAAELTVVGGAPGDNLNVGVVHGMTRRPSALKMGQGKSMLKLGGPSQESVTAGLAEARKAEQARVRPSKKVGGDPATVEETGKLMTQKI